MQSSDLRKLAGQCLGSSAQRSLRFRGRWNNDQSCDQPWSPTELGCIRHGYTHRIFARSTSEAWRWTRGHSRTAEGDGTGGSNPGQRKVESAQSALWVHVEPGALVSTQGSNYENLSMAGRWMDVLPSPDGGSKSLEDLEGQGHGRRPWRSSWAGMRGTHHCLRGRFNDVGWTVSATWFLEPVRAGVENLCPGTCGWPEMGPVLRFRAEVGGWKSPPGSTAFLHQRSPAEAWGEEQKGRANVQNRGARGLGGNRNCERNQGRSGTDGRTTLARSKEPTRSQLCRGADWTSGI